MIVFKRSFSSITHSFAATFVKSKLIRYNPDKLRIRLKATYAIPFSNTFEPTSRTAQSKDIPCTL